MGLCTLLLSSLLASPVLFQDVSGDESSDPGTEAPVAENGGTTGEVSDGSGADGSEAVTTVPWDLLRIADAESRRAAERLETQVSERLLDVALLRPEHPRVAANIAQIAAMGPDVTPLLVRIIRDTPTTLSSSANRTGEYAVRALLLVFRQTGDQELLNQLQTILREDNHSAHVAILRGIVELDHPLAMKMAQPFLSHEDSRLSRSAITVISRQSSQTSAGLLRPLLVPDGPNVDMVILSLQRLEDAQSAEAVGRVLAGSKSRLVRARAVSFLSQYGGLDVLPTLASLLQEEPGDDETDYDAFMDLKSACLNAVMEIGLRAGNRPSTKARDILVDFWSTTQSIKLRGDAAWSLGPYQHDPAFEQYETRFKSDIRSRNRRTDPTPYITFARAQIQFEKWDDALATLRKATSLDEKKVMAESIARLRGAAYCGQEKWDRAEREFLTIPGNRSDLPIEFRCVKPMAALSKYEELFQPN